MGSRDMAMVGSRDMAMVGSRDMTSKSDPPSGLGLFSTVEAPDYLSKNGKNTSAMNNMQQHSLTEQSAPAAGAEATPLRVSGDEAAQVSQQSALASHPHTHPLTNPSPPPSTPPP